MKNIFDSIDYKFFQIFSGDNRRMHAEIIMKISDYFKKHNASFVEKEDLVVYLTDYIANRDFNKVLDDQGNDISSSTAREKALSKINLFKRNGWLIEETIEEYVDVIMFDDNALIILKSLEDISSNSTPKEYTGYIYVINNLLRYFDYSQGISILEQIYDNTETLMNRLRGLNSSIKKYLTKLLKDDSEDANKLVKTLLGDYQQNVVNKAFSNLKLSDNPSKFKNLILNKLDELRSDGMSKLVDNFKTTKSSKEDDEVIRDIIIKQIDFIYDNIRYLQQTIQMIDIKNAKYVKSSTSKISFLLSENYDVEGKIDNILRLMKKVVEDDIYLDSFSLYKMDVLDEKSLYKPRKYSKYISEIDLDEVSSLDHEYVDKVRQNLFKENKFSMKNINLYINKLLTNKTSIKASDIELSSFEDFAKLILVQLYSNNKKMCYELVSLNSAVIRNNIEFNDFKIKKRGDISV